MAVPVIYQLMTRIWDYIYPTIRDFIDDIWKDGREVIKSLEHECRIDSWGDEVGLCESRNNILQKAIMLYIGEMKNIKLPESIVSLMAVKEKGTFNDDSWEMEYGNTAEQLQGYSVNTLPPEEVWIELRPGLKFMQSIEEEEGDSKKKVTKLEIIYTFKASGKDAEKRIDDFIQEAYDWYLARMRATEDKGRYLYVLVRTPPAPSSGGEGEGDKTPSRVYKRYKLSDAKNFSCLFFKEKQMLLKLLQHFQDKTDKYAIQGYPHKLGLLLHGPPGTGKTSLIKAMAQHTGRSVVSIPLARIETNQELMDIVFDQSFSVKGEDMPVKLSFKDIIFVMEDVDAASPVVHSRKSDQDEDPSGTDDDIGDDAVMLGPAAPGETDMMMAMLSSLVVSDPMNYKGSKYMSRNDKLDLSGLLNVLDGVVDCPNRILIMTTNHPEKLDPALIRPGRIDKILYLGYLQAPEAKEMVEHYFQEPLTEERWKRLESIMASPPGVADMTPAEVEQLCAEYDEVDEFLDALEEKVLHDSAANSTR